MQLVLSIYVMQKVVDDVDVLCSIFDLIVMDNGHCASSVGFDNRRRSCLQASSSMMYSVSVVDVKKTSCL